MDRLRAGLEIEPGETTPGLEVTLTEVECLCGCEMAPMAQLDERFVGPLTAEAVDSLISDAPSPPGSTETTPEPEPYLSKIGRAHG